MIEGKRKYRRTARRSAESYLARDQSAREKQALGRAKALASRREKAKLKRLGQYVEVSEEIKKRPVRRTTVERMNILEFAESDRGLGLNLYPAQRVLLKVFYALPLDEKELDLFRQITGNERQAPPDEEMTEGVWALGARSGKSFLAAIVALFESTRPKWRRFLRKGEVGFVLIIATRLAQAQQIIQRNAAQMLLDSPLSHLLAAAPTQTEITLTNKMKIMSLPCNSTSGRGLPNFCLIFDEISHFYFEGARADIDIYNSLRPRQAQFPGAKLLMISTPAAKQGIFWEHFKEGFGVPQRLTAQAPSIVMNPTLSKDFLAREQARDVDNYEREFDAQFAERQSSYLDSEKIELACCVGGDLLPQQGLAYYCAIDQSGLSGRDRFGLAVAHISEGKIVTDVTRSWDSTDPDEIMGEIKQLSEAYGFKSLLLDKYGGGWVRSAVQKLGLEALVREGLPMIYSNFKSLLLAGRLALPDNVELREGLKNTIGFYSKNNSLSIAHERTAGHHADLADAVVSACWAASVAAQQPREEVVVFDAIEEFLPFGISGRENPYDRAREVLF